jgi:hypothetical protein
MSSWYKKSMPTVKDVKPHLREIAKLVKSIEGVNDIFIWGSLAKNMNCNNFIIKDIDIIAKNNFFSEDLLAIIDDTDSPFKIASVQELEAEGFDPLAVSFTKSFIGLKKFNLDHWAISKDNKLLHWGAVVGDEEAWNDIKKEAESYASFILGVPRKHLSKKGDRSKTRWSMLYDYHINKYLKDIPVGWYTSELPVKEVLSQARRID